jgi:hypothetical protein
MGLKGRTKRRTKEKLEVVFRPLSPGEKLDHWFQKHRVSNPLRTLAFLENQELAAISFTRICVETHNMTFQSY